MSSFDFLFGAGAERNPALPARKIAQPKTNTASQKTRASVREMIALSQPKKFVEPSRKYARMAQDQRRIVKETFDKQVAGENARRKAEIEARDMAAALEEGMELRKNGTTDVSLEAYRENNRKKVAQPLTKLIASLRARMQTGTATDEDVVVAGLHPDTLAMAWEDTIWEEHYEGNLHTSAYAQALTQDMQDLNMWITHWYSEELQGCDQFREFIHRRFGQAAVEQMAEYRYTKVPPVADCDQADHTDADSEALLAAFLDDEDDITASRSNANLASSHLISALDTHPMAIEHGADATPNITPNMAVSSIDTMEFD